MELPFGCERIVSRYCRLRFRPTSLQWLTFRSALTLPSGNIPFLVPWGHSSGYCQRRRSLRASLQGTLPFGAGIKELIYVLSRT